MNCAEREVQLDINTFEKKPYWTIEAVFTTDKSEDFKAKHSIEKIHDKAEAERLFEKINGQNGTVTNISKKKAIKEAIQQCSATLSLLPFVV